jgi:hypothetical protein
LALVAFSTQSRSLTMMMEALTPKSSFSIRSDHDHSFASRLHTLSRLRDRPPAAARARMTEDDTVITTSRKSETTRQGSRSLIRAAIGA